MRTFSYKREEVSTQLKQRINKSLTLLYRYAYRAVAVNQATLKITPELIPLLSQPVRLGLLSGNLIQDRRDDPLDPHKGIYNTLERGCRRAHLRFAARLRARAGAQLHLPSAGQARWCWRASTEIGDIDAFHYSGTGEDAVPLPERFFGGGSLVRPRLSPSTSPARATRKPASPSAAPPCSSTRPSCASR